MVFVNLISNSRYFGCSASRCFCLLRKRILKTGGQRARERFATFCILLGLQLRHSQIIKVLCRQRLFCRRFPGITAKTLTAAGPPFNTENAFRKTHSPSNLRELSFVKIASDGTRRDLIPKRIKKTGRGFIPAR